MTPAEYERALAECWRLRTAPDGTPEAARFRALADACWRYEEARWPIAPPEANDA